MQNQTAKELHWEYRRWSEQLANQYIQLKTASPLDDFYHTAREARTAFMLSELWASIVNKTKGELK